MRRSLRFAALLAVTAIAANLAASASKAQGTQDPARLAAARELMEASGGMRMTERMLDKMLAGMLSQMRQQDASAVEPVLGSVLSLDSPKVKSYFNEVMDIMTQFYAERFTLEELRQITAFQRSPVGQKYQKVLPEASGRIGAALIKFQMSIEPEMRDSIRRALEARRK